MAKSSAARKPVLTIHPAGTSRIERASSELTGPPTEAEQDTILDALAPFVARFGVRPVLRALETHKDDLSARLLAMVKREGEEVTTITKGETKTKMVYETELHKFQTIAGKNVYIGEQELRLVMTACSIPVKVQEKILKCKKVTEYEYVGVYKKDPAEVKV
jgi:hypothetical protein